MDTQKRLFLALTISFVFLILWGKFTAQKNEPVREIAKTEDIIPAQEVPLSNALPSLQQYEFDSGLHTVTLLEPLAEIEVIKFDAYQNHAFILERGFSLNDQRLIFERESVTSETIRYKHEDSEKIIEKVFNFSKSRYDFDLEIVITNKSVQQLPFQYSLILGNADYGSQNKLVFSEASIATQDQLRPVYSNLRKEFKLGNLKFISLRDRYFCVIVAPEGKEFTGFINNIAKNKSTIGIGSSNFNIAPQGSVTHKFRVFAGPQDPELLKQYNPDWQLVVHYGKLDLVARVLWEILRFLNSVVKNWGWTIILFSIFIFIVMYPLSLQSTRSMKSLQKLQPQMEELRCKFKDNPQRLNKEVFELYRQHKVNPLGGCLPLILQIPIFFALFQVLSRSVALKGAEFLWISDLSEPDRLMVFGKSLPFVGNEFNILPILMLIIMFFQQKFSMVKGTGPQAEQQKIMTIVFPIMFGFLFYHMPAGLVLYWLVNSLLTVGQQALIYKTK